MSKTAKEERDEQEAAQAELSRRLVTKTHVPNKVPVHVAKHIAEKLHKTKAIEIYSNSTLLVDIDGVKHIVSIPHNRLPWPAAGDAIAIRIRGDYLSLAKPEVESKK